MTQQKVIDYLRSNPLTTAATLHRVLDVPVSGTCSRLHREGVIRAESIWITDKPTIKKPVLHYFVEDAS